MSFLRWFGKKEQTNYAATAPGSDLLQSDATLPMSSALTAPRPQPVPDRKSERHERRDLLYGVVRESMTAAGLLSSTYKFKVLSLDSSGRKYLIMMDIPRDYFARSDQFSALEGAIARAAKERYDLLVTAVYWRMNELSAASVVPPAATQAAATSQTRATPRAVVPPAMPVPVPVVDSLAMKELDEEVRAFKQALASGDFSGTFTSLDEDAEAPNRQGADFSDTVPYETVPNLGPTQFGRLE
jgi:hypothetical protein